MRYCTSDQDTMTKTLPLSMAKYNANNQKKKHSRIIFQD